MALPKGDAEVAAELPCGFPKGEGFEPEMFEEGPAVPKGDGAGAAIPKGEGFPAAVETVPLLLPNGDEPLVAPPCTPLPSAP